LEIWTGFAIGFLGSFHCIGMCGPIALALPVFTQSHFELFVGRLLYNLGRVITYSIFGLVFGLIGNRLLMIGLQQYLSILLGASILFYVFLPMKYKSKLSETKLYKTLKNLIQSTFTMLIKNPTTISLFLFGIVNGFLPCGFVYVAVAGAVTTGSLLESILFMALFGIGTIPIMLATSIAGKYINVTIRKRIRKLIPVLAAFLAIIFILRGMNLGIPYLSPKLNKAHSSEKMMHR